jgi:hypothetical protein
VLEGLAPRRIWSPAATGACWRRHRALSERRCLCTQSHLSDYCTSDSAAFASLAVGSDGVVRVRSGSHRRAYMALYWFRLSERLARVPEPSVPVNNSASRCSIEDDSCTWAEGERQLRQQGKSLWLMPMLARRIWGEREAWI